MHVANGNREPVLELTIRHFHTQARRVLDEDGVRIPDLDPAALRAAIERACNAFAIQH